MASLNQVSIELQVTGEREATQALKRYTNAGDKLKRSVLDAAGKVESTTKAWDRANRMFEKGTLNSKGLRAAQTQLARELAIVNGYVKSNGALNTQKALAELRAAQATRDAAAAEAAKTAEMKRVSQSYNQLRAAIDPAYAARMRLKQAADTLRAAERQGLITRQQAIEQLRLYRDAAQQAAAGGGFMGRSVSRAGVLTQQAGYQVGDFIVQIQSGTNAFVAFGQQATQIAGTLTLLGGKWILLGTVLGIAIPLLTAVGAAFMRTREAADDGADGIKTYAEEAKDARAEIEKTRLEIDALNKGFRDTTELSLQKGIEEAAAEVIRAQRALEGAQIRGTSIGGGPGITPAQAQENVENAEEELEARRETLRLLREQRATQEAITRGMDDRNDMLEREAKLVEQRRDAVEAIKDAMADETLAMNNRLELLQTEIRYGKDSAELAEVIAEQAREKYRAELLSNGIMGNNLKTQMDLYDAVVETENQLDSMNKAQDALTEGAESFKRIWVSITGQISTSTQQMISAAQQLNEMRFEFSPGGRAMARYGGRGTTSDRPISGDIPETPTPTGGTGTASATQEDYLAKLRQEAELKLSMIGLSEQEQRRLEIENDLKQKGLSIEDKRIDQVLRAENALRMAQEAEKRREDIMNVVTNNIESALMSVVDGTKSVEDAFKGMLRTIILEIYKQQVASPIAEGAGTFLKSLFANANGNAFNRGNVIPFANGGVVGSPTTFPMANGNTGLMGEAGPEAIMPLKRGKDGKLGVVSEGGGSVNIVQNFNISANGDDSVKRIVRQQIPQIAEATKAAVVDSKRRGGSYGRAFG